MKLKLIGEVDTSDMQESYYDKKFANKRTEIDGLMGRSTFMRAKTNDGKLHWMADVNFMGGVCDCCSEASYRKVVKYEFYSLED